MILEVTGTISILLSVRAELTQSPGWAELIQANYDLLPERTGDFGEGNDAVFLARPV